MAMKFLSVSESPYFGEVVTEFNETNIEKEIDELEQLWSTEAIDMYKIFIGKDDKWVLVDTETVYDLLNAQKIQKAKDE